MNIWLDVANQLGHQAILVENSLVQSNLQFHNFIAELVLIPAIKYAATTGFYDLFMLVANIAGPVLFLFLFLLFLLHRHNPPLKHETLYLPSLFQINFENH